MKYCSYCDRPIEGDATAIDDDSDSRSHVPVYWHADPAECGPRVQPLPGPEPTSPYAPVTDAMRNWYARQPRP